MTSREPDRFGTDFSRLDSIVERTGHVVSGDDLERDQEVAGGRRDALVLRDDLDAPYPHPVSVDDLQEVRADAESLDHFEPVGRRPAERLSLVGSERGDHFAEHTDLVREDEPECVYRARSDALSLAF